MAPDRKLVGLWFKSWWWRNISPFAYLVVSLMVGYLKAAIQAQVVGRLSVYLNSLVLSSSLTL